MRGMKMAHSRLNRITIGDIVIGAIMVLLCAAALYPVWYTIIISFNDSSDAMRGGIYWFPRKFSLESYKTVFQDKTIVRAFMITVLRTVIGTVTSVFFTAMVGYAFSKKYIMGNKVYTIIGTITMFFGGGLIPYFITLKNLGLYDNFLVYIIPSLFNFYNMIIFMSFFRELPAGLEESAKLDGANDMLIFIKIILPLSMPVLATIALFNGVGHWNDYFAGVMYINKAELQPIQTYLYRVVASASASKAVVAMPAGVSAQQVSSQSVRLATMVVTTFPIMCVYPFLQKYFVKGMLIGSIKG